MVVLGMSPFHIGIETVISSAALVFIPQTLFRRFLSFTVFLHNTLRPLLHARMDKHIQAIRFLPENIIRAAPDDDAGAFFRQLFDYPALDIPDLILICQAHAAICKHCGEPSAGGGFSFLPDIVGSIAALLRDLLDQLRVIARDSQLLGNHFPDGTSAASEFAADGNHSVKHGSVPPCSAPCMF